MRWYSSLINDSVPFIIDVFGFIVNPPSCRHLNGLTVSPTLFPLESWKYAITCTFLWIFDTLFSTWAVIVYALPVESSFVTRFKVSNWFCLATHCVSPATWRSWAVSRTGKNVGCLVLKEILTTVWNTIVMCIICWHSPCTSFVPVGHGVGVGSSVPIMELVEE